MRSNIQAGDYGAWPQGAGSGSRLAAALAKREFQDAVFAALMVASRIPSNLGMPGALAFLLLAGFYAALRLDQSRDAISRCWPQLLFPAFALMSVAWAVYPAMTLRAAVQMTLTAFGGLLLSQSPRPRAVLTGLFVAYAGYAAASLLAGNVRPDGVEKVMALNGLGGEAKNYFADTSGTGALLALAMMASCLQRRAFALSAMAAGMAAGMAGVCVLGTYRAHSAGALASLALSASLLLILLILRRRAPGLKLGFVIVLLAVFASCAIFFQPLLTLVQEMSSKDAGLTGRGYLWYRADFIIAQRPWLGMGYFGFWTPANPDAIGLWRYFDVRQEGTAFSFHNSYIQTMVETGYVGLGVMVGCWMGGILALLRRFVLTPSLATCFWLSYLALQLSKSPVELVRPAALVAPTIMLFAALGFGCFPITRLARTQPGQQLQAGASFTRRSSSRSIASNEAPLLSNMHMAENRLIAPAPRM